jgi:hypothetical protein
LVNTGCKNIVFEVKTIFAEERVKNNTLNKSQNLQKLAERGKISPKNLHF